jgi:hypothetical protein
MIWLDGQILGRNIIGKLMTRRPGERGMWKDLAEWPLGEILKIFVSHVNVTLTEEKFNNNSKG